MQVLFAPFIVMSRFRDRITCSETVILLPVTLFLKPSCQVRHVKALLLSEYKKLDLTDIPTPKVGT